MKFLLLFIVSFPAFSRPCKYTFVIENEYILLDGVKVEETALKAIESKCEVEYMYGFNTEISRENVFK